MIIFYTNLSDKHKIGSTNRKKIESLAIYPGTVLSCEMWQFDGKLLSSNWNGVYKTTIPAKLNFKITA